MFQLSEWIADIVHKESPVNRRVRIPRRAWRPLRDIVEREMKGKLVVVEDKAAYEIRYRFGRRVNTEVVSSIAHPVLKGIVNDHTR
jgi:hypothetical protein